MTGYLIGAGGAASALPPLLSWDVTHGCGEPCDCFEVTCLYSASLAEALHGACRFRGVWQGETVFLGVVDEWTAEAGEDGMLLTVSGRGLAALLMDNEADAAEYRGADLDFILKKHVLPYGITDMRVRPMGKAGLLSVASGDSQWKVLRSFCRFCGGVEPRFSRGGTLLLDGSRGETRALDASRTGALQRWSERRYGVISEAVVRNRAAGAEVTVRNETFLARGGSARRVVNVPRRTGWDAMRYTGSYQIAESERSAALLRLTLPAPFAAFAGDVIALRASAPGVSGTFAVRESRTRVSGQRAETILTLTRC